jgi:NAD(P)-dependent dehydrogenase (short-subunit alcohol dehydrogenase family)
MEMFSESLNQAYSSNLLRGKRALVTGGGKGIGRACAVALVHAGATVIAVARTETDLNSLSAEFGSKIVPWVMDATSEEFIEHIKQETELSILVNNLGANKPEPFVEIQPETYDRIVDMNFGTVFRTTQAVVANMLNGKISGSIINISSQMGHVGSPNRVLYCATKHAVEGFTKALAVELAPNNIRVNSIAPTFVDTPMTRPMLADPKFNDFVMSKIPMNKLASSEDVAASAVYLASELSRMVTGTSLLVDGGWVAQ